MTHARSGYQAVDDAELVVAGAPGPAAASTSWGKDAGGCRAEGTVWGIRRDVQRGGPTLDPAGATAQGICVDGAIHRAQRAAVLRAARLQPAVPLVPRHEYGREDLRPNRVHEESRATAQARRGGQVFRSHRRAGPERGLDERRTFHGGRHAD